ncbi:hypothetical protein [Acidianus brierleyi]|nr:hypothetical protein [Acidianus brierleyi]
MMLEPIKLNLFIKLSIIGAGLALAALGMSHVLVHAGEESNAYEGV